MNLKEPTFVKGKITHPIKIEAPTFNDFLKKVFDKEDKMGCGKKKGKRPPTRK